MPSSVSHADYSFISMWPINLSAINAQVNVLNQHKGHSYIVHVEATELSEFTNYAHILRSVYNHDVATLVPSWQQCVLLS